MKTVKYFLICLITSTLILGCSNVPSDVKYEILKEQFDKTYKKSMIDVRINKRVSKDILVLIAEEIKSKYPDSKNYMISYYLPDMDTNAAWAITNYNPDPDIQIIGASETEDKEMKESTIGGADIIGKWKDNTPHMERLIIIFKQNDTLKLRSVYPDKSFGDDLIKLVKQNNADKYVRISNPQEYYVIGPNGNLTTYSNDKKFSESMKQ